MYRHPVIVNSFNQYFFSLEVLKQTISTLVLPAKGDRVGQRGGEEGGAGTRHRQGAPAAAGGRGHGEVVGGEEIEAKVTACNL